MKVYFLLFIYLLFIQSSFSISSSNDQSFLNSPSKRMEPKDDVDNDNLVVVSKSSPSGLIANFRQAAGIHNIYRCASTDLLADYLYHGCDDLTRIQWQQPTDRFVFEKAGCILDLRSPNERDEFKARKWTAIAGLKVLDIDNDDNSFSLYNLFGKHQRIVTRINVLSPARFKSYIEQHWLSPTTDMTRNTFGKERELHVLRMKAMNDRGLFGLNQIILETGKEHLCKALQLITMYLERYPKNNIVIHCVQGKDRTGMLVMLLQSILGYSDEVIIQDYVLSNQMLGGSAAVADTGMKQTSNMNRNLFSGANQITMRQTLTFLRTTYGSIVPDYTNSIGFDEHWRKRLLAVLIPTNHKAGTRSRL